MNQTTNCSDCGGDCDSIFRAIRSSLDLPPVYVNGIDRTIHALPNDACAAFAPYAEQPCDSEAVVACQVVGCESPLCSEHASAHDDAREFGIHTLVERVTANLQERNQ